MVETQQLIWNTTTNSWQQQTVSTLYTARQIPGASVVYNIGTTVAGYVFDTFLGALNAIQASNTPTTMYIDGSAGQPVVPAGVYDLGLVSLMQMPGQTNTSLNISNGASFNVAPSVIGGGLSLCSFSNSPVIDQANLSLLLKDGSFLQTAGSAPFIHVGAGATAQLFLSDGSYLAGSDAGATAPELSSDLGSIFTGINVGNFAAIGLNALDGYGPMEANYISPSAVIEAQHTAYSLLTYNANLACTVAYTPANDGYWANSPTSVCQALDELAAKSSGSSSSSANANDYALFFALMPGDNSATVGVGTAVQFPQDGPTSGTILRTNASTFNLPSAGDYEVSFQVSVAEPGQLQLALNGSGLPNTVVGRATGTSQLVCNTIITTSTANALLSVINPAGNSTALTITPVAGGASPVSATLSIKSL